MLGYWPGAAVHQRATLENVRFEDFEYSSFEENSEDCLAWMGNGRIQAAENDTSTTGYLDEVDIPPVPNATPLTPLSSHTESDFVLFSK